MDAHNTRNFTLNIAVVFLGDVAVFLAFVVLGGAEHGNFQSAILVRTALPFATAWFVISPWLGAYRGSTLYNFRAIASRIVLIWLLCGLVGLLARTVMTDRPLTPTFVLVALVVQGALLISWRSVFTISTRWFSSS